MKDYLWAVIQIGLGLTLLVDIVPAPQSIHHPPETSNNAAPDSASSEMPIEHAMADLERLAEMEIYEFGNFDKEEEKKKNILSEKEWAALPREEKIGTKTIPLDQCICRDENKWRCPKGYTCKKVGGHNCEESFKQKQTLCTPNPTPCPKGEMGGPCMNGKCHSKEEMSDIREGYIDAFACKQGYCCLIKKAKHSKTTEQKNHKYEHIQTFEELAAETDKKDLRRQRKAKDWAHIHNYSEHPMVNF